MSDDTVYRFDADETPVGAVIFGELVRHDDQGLRFRAHEQATIERVQVDEHSLGWRAEGVTYLDEVCVGAHGSIVSWPHRHAG